MKSFVILLSVIFSFQTLSAESKSNHSMENPNQEDNLSELNSRGLHYYSVGPKVTSGTYTLIRDHKTPDKVKIKISKKFEDKVPVKSNLGFSMSNGVVAIDLPRTLATDNRKEIQQIILDFTDVKKLIEGKQDKISLTLDFSKGYIDVSKVLAGAKVDDDRQESKDSYVYKTNRSTWFQDKGINETVSFRVKAVKE